jgi:aspartate oxidase
LLDGHSKRFAKRFHKDGELATRDVVARAINTIMQEQELDAVGLDLRPIGEERLNSHFPNILKTCRQFGIDPLAEPIPVAPAAHYFMGGVLTDAYGQTSINNLYAIGECAATGLHGANRLASNSLLEAGVMALRVAEHVAAQDVPTYPQPTVSLLARRSQAIPCDIDQLRKQMYERAGLLRNETGLISLLNDLANDAILEVPTTAEQVTAANLLVIAKLITRAALTRQESRGAHYRLDYPQTDNVHLLKRRVLSRSTSHWLPVGAPGRTTTVATVS